MSVLRFDGGQASLVPTRLSARYGPTPAATAARGPGCGLRSRIHTEPSRPDVLEPELTLECFRAAVAGATVFHPPLTKGAPDRQALSIDGERERPGVANSVPP